MTKDTGHIEPQQRSVDTRLLRIAYEEWGPANGFPIVLLHGFPDDVHAWDDVAPILASDGNHVLVPYLRGFGPTRFLDPSTPRISQQATLGGDLLDFMDTLKLPKAVLAGYDWGCTAACVASILQPNRVAALLAIHGYGVGDTHTPELPAPPAEERECWYHWYFQIERGRRGLEANRKALCLMLWRMWSPKWKFSIDIFERTSRSFENPDFVPVVIHAYRHAHGGIPSDPSYAETESMLTKRPAIAVPSMVLHGTEDSVHPPHRSVPDMTRFPAGTERLLVYDAGHFVPREKPEVVVDAIRKLTGKETLKKG